MLREQLDQATAANQSLTNDIHKLTNDWQRAREELETKEADWREEEQVTLNQGDVIKFVNNLRQVGGFLRVLWFPPPIKLTAMI
jgi:chromosome segregation ATPase